MEHEVDFTIEVVTAKKVACPYCKSESRQRQYGKAGNVAYYRCLKCVLPRGSGENTKYKVIFQR